MGYIRINELARELEVKPSIILEMLPELGVLEKKTHSSPIGDDIARAIKERLVEMSKTLEASLAPASPVAPEPPPIVPPRRAPLMPPLGSYSANKCAPTLPIRPPGIGLRPLSSIAPPLPPATVTPSLLTPDPNAEAIPELDLPEPSVGSGEAGRSFCLQRYMISEYAKNAQKQFKKLPRSAPREWQYAVECYSLVIMYGLLHGLLERVGVPPDQAERFLGRKPSLAELYGALLMDRGIIDWTGEQGFCSAASVRNRIAHPWVTGQPSFEEVRSAKAHLEKYLLEFVEDAIDWAELTRSDRSEDLAKSFYHYVALSRGLE